MKSDKTKPATKRQHKQAERLGYELPEGATVHDASRIANKQSATMMPDFAKGWEKDGWVSDGGKSWVLLIRENDSNFIGEVICTGVCVDGSMEISDETGDSVRIHFSDPLIAKQKAEQLMEGLV